MPRNTRDAQYIATAAGSGGGDAKGGGRLGRLGGGGASLAGVDLVSVAGAGTSKVNGTYRKGPIYSPSVKCCFVQEIKEGKGRACKLTFWALMGCPHGWYLEDSDQYGVYFNASNDPQRLPSDEGWESYTEALSRPGTLPLPLVRANANGLRSTEPVGRSFEA